jgi:hypothetical protein
MQPIKALLASIALHLLPTFLLAETIADFEGGYFKMIKKDKNVYPLDIGVGSVSDGLIPLAYADINNDSYTDFISTNTAKNLLRIHLFNKVKNVFEVTQTIDFGGKSIIGVMADDMDTDNNVDLVVTFSEIPSSIDQYRLPRKVGVLLQQSGSTYGDSSSMRVTQEVPTGEPVMFQTFNDQTKQLQTFFILQTSSSERLVFYMDGSKNLGTMPFTNLLVTGNSNCLNYQDNVVNSQNQLDSRRGSHFIDINGDCQPDLILQTLDKNENQYMEFYYAVGTTGFCLVQSKLIDNQNFSMAAFADMNNDGGNDLLILSQDLTLHVFINSISADQENLCKTATLTDFPYQGLDSLITPQYSAYHFFFKLQPNGVPANRYQSSFVPGSGVIRTGDLDLDGYIDITFQYMISGDSPKVAFYQNSACSSEYIDMASKNYAGGNPDFSRCRSYNMMTDYVSIVSNPATGNQNVFSVSFFDFAELG